jgi:hypothetical protein
MKKCIYRYSEKVLIGGKYLLVYKCGISEPKGAIVGEEVCSGCDVVDLVLDCEHLSPRVKHFLGYRTETFYRCNYFNAILDPEKGFCRVCRYKSKKAKRSFF